MNLWLNKNLQRSKLISCYQCRERIDVLTRSHIPGPSRIAKPPRASTVGLSGLPRLSRSEEPSKIPSSRIPLVGSTGEPLLNSLIEALLEKLELEVGLQFWAIVAFAPARLDNIEPSCRSEPEFGQSRERTKE